MPARWYDGPGVRRWGWGMGITGVKLCIRRYATTGLYSLEVIFAPQGENDLQKKKSTIEAKVNLPMTIEEGATYLLNVAGVTLMQLFALGGPALLLIALLSWLSGRVHRLAYRAIGRSTFLLLFGWFGTVIHELGHLLAALLFRQQIKSFRPFAPEPDGTLGSVTILPGYGNILQYFGIFFFGIAPVLFGPLVIFLALYSLFYGQMHELWRTLDLNTMPGQSVIGGIVSGAVAIVGFLFSPRHLIDWHLYLFLYIAFSIGSSIHLSDEDITAAKLGCLPFIILLFLFNTVLFALGSAGSATFAWLTQYYTFLYLLLCFVILLDVLAILILWLPAALRAP